MTAPAVHTFLFADVRGYTTYTRERGDEAGAELARRFAAIVEATAPTFSGTLQELRGDEALVVFDSPREALQFALALQARVAKDELPRPVGIGLDTGEAVAVDGGYRGSALNRAARLCALARPGQVLASDAVRDLAGAIDGVTYGFRHTERLKGFDKPVAVIEIHPSDAAPGRELHRHVKRSMLGTRPRRRGALALTAVVAAAVLVAVLGLSRDNANAFAIDSVGLLDAATLHPRGTAKDVGRADFLWNDLAGTVWAVDFAGQTLTGIDTRSGNVTRFPARARFGGIARAAGSLWLGDYDHARVLRLDPKYGRIQKTIILPVSSESQAGFTSDITASADSVWVSYGRSPFRIARIDARTNRVVKSFELPHHFAQALIKFDHGSLWVANQETGLISRIDPATYSEVAKVKLPSGHVRDFRVVGGFAWAAITDDPGVWKIDSQGTTRSFVKTGDLPRSLSDDGKSLYVTNSNAGTLTRIDPKSDAMRTISLGHRPDATAVAGGKVWVEIRESRADARSGLDEAHTLRMVSGSDPAYTSDPAVASDDIHWQIQYAIGARLLRSPDSYQPRGATLLPEIGELPIVSNGGRTYTFRIRPGYEFSPGSNEPVTAAAMRFSIERALSPRISDSLASAFVSDIVGVDAYRRGKASHVSGISVGDHTISFTLLKPAPDFPSRISRPEFSAVPLGTPAYAHGIEPPIRPIPSAGPYYVASEIEGSQAVLRRNPHYPGPRPHRLNAIVIEDDAADTGAQRAVSGDVDYASASDRPPYSGALAPGGTLDRRFGAKSPASMHSGQRYFLPPISQVSSLAFDSRRGIFRNARLRRAVNYAIDRPALAAVLDARPSDALIPPGVPGTGMRAVYPLERPNVARARALAGSAHRTAILYADAPTFCPSCKAIVAILVRDLARIGVTVQPRFFDAAVFAARNPHARWDLLLNFWFGDYVDPSDYLNVLFDPKSEGGFHSYNDTRYVPRMRAAYEVNGRKRAGAYRALETDMMRESPPSAPFAVERRYPQIFSKRVGCQVFRPQDNGLVDLAALCLK